MLDTLCPLEGNTVDFREGGAVGDRAPGSGQAVGAGRQGLAGR
jgi:hypothetical protein